MRNASIVRYHMSILRQSVNTAMLARYMCHDITPGAEVAQLLQLRNMGKKLFMDESTLQVPFLAGSMTDQAFVSATNSAATPTGKTTATVVQLFVEPLALALGTSPQPLSLGSWHWPLSLTLGSYAFNDI